MKASFKKMILVFLVASFVASKEVDLVEPRSVHLNDPTESVRLAVSEKITAPMAGTLSYEVKYQPEHSGECTITSNRDHFVQAASRNLNPGYYSMVSSIITLKEAKLAVLIDTNFYIAAFNLDNNKIEDRVVNRTLKAAESNSFHDVPLLVADQLEVYILAISSSQLYIVNVSDLKKGQLSFKEVKQTLGDSIVKGQIINGVLFLATRQAGIKAYKIDHEKGIVQLLYTIHDFNTMCEDFAIEKQNKMLYLLDFDRGIEVYNVSNTAVKPPIYDFIDLSQKSVKNTKIQVENDVVLVSFFHRSQNVVAELNYKVKEKKFSFMRYFKFKDILIDIHLMGEHMVAVGDVFVAVFPVNIHPKLIQNQMNGNIALSPIRKVVKYNGPYFLAITNDNLLLGEIKTDNYDQLSCALRDNSKLKKIVYQANVTSCGGKREYYDYCTYTKEVEFQKMEVIAGEKTAKGLWVAIVVLCALIAAGVLFLYLMRRKKERTILFLESQFQKKRTMAPLPSQRLSHRVGVDPTGTDQIDNIVPVPLTEENIEKPSQ